MENTYIINNIVEFLTPLQTFELPLFRGQSEDWSLLPSIGRHYDVAGGYADWDEFEDYFFEEFKKYSLPYLTRQPASKYEWLVIAQHHGLPTRLLDWTTNPLKAAFFAVEDVKNKHDGVVWGLKPQFGSWLEDVSKADEILVEEEKILVFYPNHINERVIAHESCFTIFPYPRGMEPMPPMSKESKYIESLVKFVIPGSSKFIFRSELERLGINYRSMYPGLDGVAKAIRHAHGAY